MTFELRPINISIHKKSEFSFSILGICYGKKYSWTSRAIGFSIRKEILKDRKIIEVNLYFYSIMKKFILKTILDDYYIRCNECGNLVRKDNHLCSECDICYDDEYLTYIYRDKNLK